MNPINSYFNKIYCVNLDRRPERWEEASKEFKKFNLDVERFSAVDGSKMNLSNIKMEVLKMESLPGAVGCSLSHRNIIKDAKKNAYDKILIFEDDVVFEDNLLTRFENEIKSLPEDWDMFYLSANNLKPESLTQINEHIWRTRFSRFP
jgi:GR25 family glycosyltransferase involved in LPS biosynthesis